MNVTCHEATCPACGTLLGWISEGVEVYAGAWITCAACGVRTSWDRVRRTQISASTQDHEDKGGLTMSDDLKYPINRSAENEPTYTTFDIDHMCNDAGYPIGYKAPVYATMGQPVGGDRSADALFTGDDLLRIDGWMQFAKDMSGGRANTRSMSDLRARIAKYLDQHGA